MSIVNLHARPGESASLSIWRIGVTNADTTVDITTDPVLAEVSATAYTDASGDDQGRIDIELTADAPAGAYQWTAEIDGTEVFAGTIYVAPHGRPASFVAHSIDIRSATTPAWIIARPEDVEGEPVGGGPATQIVESGGPTTLDIGAIADGEYARRSGDTLVGDTPAGSGDVTAAVAFAADNRLVTSDGTGKGVKASSVTVNGAAVSGVSTLAMTGALTGATSISTTDLTATGTITGISASDVGADAAGTATAAVTAHEGQADPHPDYQLRAEKGAPDGYASLDTDGNLVEPALAVVADGPSMYTFGAIGDGQYLKLDGAEIVGDTPAGTGDVTGPAGATVDSVPTLDATGKVLTETPVTIDAITGDVTGVGDLSMSGALTGATAITTTDLTATGTITGISAADVGADASGAAAAAITAHESAADPHPGYQRESEKGSPGGYSSLDGDGNVVEPALSITDGTTTFTIGALVDTEVLYVDGTEVKSKSVGDVTGPAGAAAESVPVLDTTGKILSETPVLIDTATGDVSGVGDLTLGGSINMAGGELVDSRDVSADGATLDSHVANTSNPHSVTPAQIGAVPVPLVLVLTADATLTTTTFIGIAPASGPTWTGISLTAGKLYRLEVYGTYEANVANTTTFQFGVDWSNPPTAQNIRSSVAATNTSVQTWAEKGLITDGQTSDNSGSVGAIDTAYFFSLVGTFIADAVTPGTFEITGRTRVTTGGESVDVKAGSTLVLTQLN